MGITKLADLIRGDAPNSISYKEIGDYTGKVIALDTSIVVNQFRSAVPHLRLSPLLGLFYRTLTFLEHDIKPVFVFDGKPPDQKRAVLERRAQILGRNSSYHSKTVSAQTQEFLRLLKLMGVPCIMASGDGEALCAHLVSTGVVDAVASEDMDTLAFGGTTLLRQLNAKKESEVTEYSLPKLLETLQLTQKEIRGLGPRRALKLIQQHHTIEDVICHVNRKTHPVPLDWKYEAARELFLEVPQVDVPELGWNEVDEEGLMQFLCQEKPIKEQKVRGRMEKFRTALAKRRKEREEAERAGQTRQSRLEEYFPKTRKRQSADAVESSSGKRPKAK
ncbi:probable flap endonuclease 1 homolog isoform X2 [Electrophorus electricus]|uniref:probable flap endonuclease 1 homolog isoform X2 n=1 Tax=Electrophorus electricus TaxID=8005 RepID=UPI0015D09C14|nr:probable flap endonuclease 1 homolog isoform X2 [Electrophorus electricus]